jgi:hypothetical protein
MVEKRMGRERLRVRKMGRGKGTVMGGKMGRGKGKGRVTGEKMGERKGKGRDMGGENGGEGREGLRV